MQAFTAFGEHQNYTTRQQRRTIAENDVTLRYLGYWTDAGTESKKINIKLKCVKYFKFRLLFIKRRYNSNFGSLFQQDHSLCIQFVLAIPRTNKFCSSSWSCCFHVQLLRCPIYNDTTIKVRPSIVFYTGLFVLKVLTITIIRWSTRLTRTRCLM